MKLTELQLKKLTRVAKVVKNGNLAITEHLFEVEEMIEDMKKEMEIRVATLQSLVEPKLKDIVGHIRGNNGKDGDKGDKGDKGDRGEKGDKGDDGINGEKGERGYDGVDGIDGTDGKDGVDGVDGKDGRDGKDGKNVSTTDIKSLKKDIEDVRNMAALNAVPPTTSFFNGMRAKNLTIDGATAYQTDDTVHLSVPSGGATLLIPTGAIDGVNTIFTFSTLPTLIFTDVGTWAQSAIGFSWNAGQATLPFAPSAANGWCFGI